MAFSSASQESDKDPMFDDDIIDIFVEEAGEVLGDIDQFLPAWRADPEDTAALQEVRRAFHTLKGSGRMVRANAVGDLAWSLENLLNKVLEGTVPANRAIFGVVEKAAAEVPGLVEQFREQKASPRTASVNTLIQQADALVKGQTVEVDIEDDVPVLMEDDLHTITTSPILTNEFDLQVNNELQLGELEDRIALQADAMKSLSATIEDVSSRLEAVLDRIETLELDENTSHQGAELGALQSDIERVSRETQDLRYFVKASSDKMMQEIRAEQARSVQLVEQRLAEVEHWRGAQEKAMAEGRLRTLAITVAASVVLSGALAGLLIWLVA